jgi:hypothetical protein
MDQNSAGFMYLKNKFPKTMMLKSKKGYFVGPQIRELIQDVKFEDQPSEMEKKQRGNHYKMSLILYKAGNYRVMIADLVQSYKAMGSNMSIKVHFLDSNLDFFPESLRAMSDEHRQ